MTYRTRRDDERGGREYLPGESMQFPVAAGAGLPQALLVAEPRVGTSFSPEGVKHRPGQEDYTLGATRARPALMAIRTVLINQSTSKTRRTRRKKEAS